jgi:hypothetical protein
MAQYKTSAEAKVDLNRQIQEKARELRQIGETTDPVLKKRYDKISAEIGTLQNKLMMTDTVGAIGGGLASGVVGTLTAIPDILIAGKNLFTGTDTKGIGERLTPGLQAVSQENAGLFGAARGFGGSWLPGGGVKLLGVGTTTGAIDESIFEGAPVTSLVAGLGMLGYSGVKGLQNYRDTKSMKKFLEQIGPEERNNLSEFLIKGQTSKDPQIAGLIDKLRTNPKYAELFTELQKGATAKTLAGMTPEATAGKVAEPIYNAYKEKIARLYDNITGEAVSKKFDKAKDLAGDRPINVKTTVDKVDELIASFSSSATDSSKASIAYLNRFKERLLGAADSTGYRPSETTITKLQGNLSSFGAEAAGSEGMLRNVSKNDQDRIAKSLFGSLKDDLNNVKTTSNDKQLVAAANLLETARNDVLNGYDALNRFRAKGLPQVFKGKEIYEFNDADLLNAFKKLDSTDLQKAKALLEVENPDALNRVKKSLYEDFVAGARNTLPDNTTGVDLQKLVTKFNGLSKEEKNTLAFALGTNVGEFESRMGDAQKFFNYAMKSGAVLPDGNINPALVSEAAFAASGGQYTAGKAGGVLARLVNYMKGGLNEEQMMKVLLTDEGKNFLKSSTLSPNGVATLDKLTTTTNSALPAAVGGYSALERSASMINAPVESTKPEVRPAIDLNVAPEAQPAPATGERPSLDLSYNPTDIESKIREEASNQGLGQYADLFVKQARQESGFNPYAVSSAGAQGVFQLMPGTAGDLGVSNPYDIGQNISGGVKYMGQLLNKYNNDPRTALAAYNWGMGNVDRQGLSNMPKETQDYLTRILG